MGLSRKPQDLKEDWWYYEVPKGIEIYHEIKTISEGYIKTDSILIPWDKIRKSLKRKDHK